MALVGGVELGVNHYDLILCSRMHLLSPARCAPFDVRADGFTIGEGAAFFVLKRLDDALRDGDPVRAVIRSIGASNDARSLIAPSAAGQALALRRAFEGVDFSPDDVDYVEAHGTGTAIGDVVEATSVRQIYGTGTRRRPLVLGSVKSMIGHTMAASGAAGVLKTVLALEAGTLPPNANLTNLNPKLRLDDIPARVLTRAEPWPRDGNTPRRAAVSSFGTGGINFHMLLEDQPV
jgi:acyl transferase domain-containing protein